MPRIDDHVPSHYKCSFCSKTGVKLWRFYSKIPVELSCALCTAKSSNVDITGMDEHGKYESKNTGILIDNIGRYVPAIPVDGTTNQYWGYVSITDESKRWWKSLPNS